MRSFLAYVAEQYGRKKEDVATDALVYLLKKHRIARTAFHSFVADECGYTLPKIYSVISRTKGPDGVPDIQISDENGVCCAIVENKFRAPLTEKQPVSYFNGLRTDGGLILFVVPKDRIVKLWSELRSRCEEADRAIEPLPGFRFSGQSAKHRLCIVFWDQLIRHLETSLDNDEAREAEVSMFIDQLRRVCEVADNETFNNLTSDQLSGAGTSALIRHLTWITRELIGRSIDKNIAQETKKKEMQAKVDVSDSSLYVGQDLLFDGVTAWIGFWPKAWGERLISPLWIVLYLPESEDDLIVKQLHKEQRDGTVVKHLFYSDDEDGWLIPIPIEPDKAQDDVVDEAFQFVSYIRSAIERAKSG
jgi:hypothetical protein